MPPELGVNVFAYGSNLHLNRMKQRAPSAEAIGIGYVVGRRINFRKRSVDGSAKADARLTRRDSDRIWGAVYRLDFEDKCALDKYESLGVGYDEQLVVVNASGDQMIDAYMYVARMEAVDESLRPYSWYLDFVTFGASQHGLPFCYISRELAIESVTDPDVSRRMTNRLILG